MYSVYLNGELVGEYISSVYAFDFAKMLCKDGTEDTVVKIQSVYEEEDWDK